jgi:hypothetical protein
MMSSLSSIALLAVREIPRQLAAPVDGTAGVSRGLCTGSAIQLWGPDPHEMRLTCGQGSRTRHCE